MISTLRFDNRPGAIPIDDPGPKEKHTADDADMRSNRLDIAPITYRLRVEVHMDIAGFNNSSGKIGRKLLHVESNSISQCFTRVETALKEKDLACVDIDTQRGV
jgi:hypothetical protein